MDIWMIDLTLVDPADGSEEALGEVCFVCWPRPSMAAEVVHTAVTQVFGREMPLALLRERPIIVPVAPTHLWRAGEQLKAIQAWLLDEEEDA